MTPELTRLTGRLRPITAEATPAAVLIPVSVVAGEVRITFVEKRKGLAMHGGQIAFPGGRAAVLGEAPVEVALRESLEEVGLAAEEVTILGQLAPISVSATGVQVTPVVGSRPFRRLQPVDIGEIEAVHDFSLAQLADPERRVTARLASGYRGPAFVIGELFIWGLTGRLVSTLLDLGGWSKPWDQRRMVPVPSRFQ